MFHSGDRRITWAQRLFVLNALIWLVFGLISLTRMASRGPDFVMTAFIVAIMMFGNVAATLIAAFGIGRQERRFYYFALAVLAVNIILTFTDEFGFFDASTLLIDLILLGLVVAARRPLTTPHR